MIPFIDVMLVLLTIVLTTSTFVATGIIPVELPKVVGRYEKIMKTRVVEIDNAGTVYFDGKRSDAADLKNVIRDVPKTVPFLIRADKNIPLQGFIEIVDVIKSAGFTRVSVQTEELRR